MATDVKLPELGENIESGQVVSVLVSEGDTIRAEQSIIEIETDKATVEVPSSAAGKVTKIHVKAGDDLKVGGTIVTIEELGAAEAVGKPSEPEAAAGKEEKKPEPPKEERKVEKPIEAKAEAPAPPKPVAAPAAPGVVMPGPGADVPAAPSVRRLALEIGVDITKVSGTGPGGRVTYDDVKAYSKRLHEERETRGSILGVPREELPDFTKWGAVEREQMSNVRRRTAEHLSFAWATIPHVTQFDKADITEVEQWRKAYSAKVERQGSKLTITAIALKVVAAALKEFPKFNASVDMENREILYKRYYHIGIAVDTDRGLLVPVIRDVDKKGLLDLAVELAEASQKARDRKLSIEEMQGATFTITNLGGIGGTNFTPVVNWPEVAILAMDRASTEPAWDKEKSEFRPRLMLPLAVSYDHRIIDGADGARFLRFICEAFENLFLLAM